LRVCLIKTVFSSYILYPEHVYFANAFKKCDSINATVVLPKNETENDFIFNNYLNNSSVTNGIWLAIYDFIGNETNVNYYTKETLLYSNWSNGEPGTISEYCTTYLKTSQWHDFPCSNTDQFSILCELPEDSKNSNTITSSTLATTSTSSTTKNSQSTLNSVKDGQYYSISKNFDINAINFLISSFTISITICNLRDDCLSVVFKSVKNNNCFIYSKTFSSNEMIISDDSLIFTKEEWKSFIIQK
jgi:hypothetical protein